MKHFLILILLLITISGQAQSGVDLTTSFLSEDGKITAVVSDNYQLPKVDTLLKVSGDLSKLPGTAEQKLQALKTPGHKVVVFIKDTTIYNKWGTTAFEYQKESFISSPDGKDLNYYEDLNPASQRPAWEMYLLYLYIVFCGFMIAYKKDMVNKDEGFGLVFGLLFGLGFGLGLLFGLVLVFGLGLGLGLVFGFGFGLGLGLGLWIPAIVCILLYMMAYLVTRQLRKKTQIINQSTAS